MYTVSCKENSYAGLIARFIKATFPENTRFTGCEQVDLLTEIILGTKNTRLGAKPRPESVVAMRDAIRHHLALGSPIPFRLSWGSEKPNGGGPDIAELMSFKTMQSLHEQISRIYPAGATFNILLEDASAPHLFYESPDVARRNAAAYVETFQELVNVLGLEKTIIPVPESTKVTEILFAAKADPLITQFEEVIVLRLAGNSGDTPRRMLQEMGWSGDLALETILFYIDRYERLYPGRSREEHIYTAARYLSACLARWQLGVRGTSEEWAGQWIDMSFSPQVPGIVSFFDRRIFYRTVPRNITTNHIPPWRARGYLVISNDNEVRCRLASFSEELDLEDYQLTLERGATKVILPAPFITE